jgi:hypothetical protein
MTMTTNLDNIPLKTNKSGINDDSDDPMVKDILNEFQQELKSVNNDNNYNINYNKQVYQSQQPPPIPQQPQQPQQPPPIPQQPIKKPSFSYYNEDLIRKTGIIIIIIAMIFSPFILPAFINKLPPYIAIIVDNYQFYFKLIILYIIFYLMFIKELI